MSFLSSLETRSEKPEISPESIMGPAWNNSTEYPGVDSNEFINDLSLVISQTAKIAQLIETIRHLMDQGLKNDSEFSPGEREGLISTLQAVSQIHEHTFIVLYNLYSFINTIRAVETRNESAMKMEAELQVMLARLDEVRKPTQLFLNQCSDQIVNDYLNHPDTQTQTFQLQHARSQKQFLLSEGEERLLTALRTHGPVAWGKLYDQLAGRLRIRLENPDGSQQEVSVSQANALLRGEDESVRKSTYERLQQAWESIEVPCASVISNLAGWRLETDARRAHTAPYNYLSQPLHANKIRLETLEAMMTAISNHKETGRRAARLMAQCFGKSALDPWDTLAGAPLRLTGAEPRPYRQGLRMVTEAFTAIDPAFGDFARMMEKNRWIEGRVSPDKRAGAFCMGFPKSRTPRVFQTYMGSMSDIKTLAHELGHAYHAWVMRDQSWAEKEYPATLAETASIFAETALSEHLTGQPGVTLGQRLESAFTNANQATIFLLNIPMRFEFEKALHEKRAETVLMPQDLRNLAEASWNDWYGDSTTAANSRFWQTTMHFSFANTRFYNFSYSFGYLFSLGVFALRAERGSAFMPSYIALLRDTGSMTVEDLAKKHLGVDLTQPEFWAKSLAIVSAQVEEFANVAQQIQPPRLRN